MVAALMECGCPETYPSGLVYWAVPCDYCKAPAGSPCVYGPNSKYGTPGQPTKNPHGGRKDAHLAAVHRSVTSPVTVAPDGGLRRGGVPVFSSPEEADAWMEAEAATNLEDLDAMLEGSQETGGSVTIEYGSSLALSGIRAPRPTTYVAAELIDEHGNRQRFDFPVTVQHRPGDTVRVEFHL